MKKTGMASAATVIALNGFKVEVLASNSNDVLISEERTMGALTKTSNSTYANAAAAIAAGQTAVKNALAQTSANSQNWGPQGTKQPCFEVSPNPGQNGVSSTPNANGTFNYVINIPAGTYTFTYYK
jgi:hypothetical protein